MFTKKDKKTCNTNRLGKSMELKSKVELDMKSFLVCNHGITSSDIEFHVTKI